MIPKEKRRQPEHEQDRNREAPGLSVPFDGDDNARRICPEDLILCLIGEDAGREDLFLVLKPVAPRKSWFSPRLPDFEGSADQKHSGHAQRQKVGTEGVVKDRDQSQTQYSENSADYE
jgi:hypothetical protein